MGERLKRRGSTALAVLAATSLAVLPVASSSAEPEHVAQTAAVKRCGSVAASVSILKIRARNTRCRSARRVARRWLRRVFAGSCSRFRCGSFGYRCYARPPAMISYRVRCWKRNPHRTVSFSIVAD